MSTTPDQQPIRRTVGRRTSRDGQPLTPVDRALMIQQAQYCTRAPKGVFFYRSAEEMEADRRRWTVDAIVERHRSWAEMKQHVTTVDIDEVPVRVLDLPGLLKTKQGVRPKDQMDAAIIAEALRVLRKPG